MWCAVDHSPLLLKEPIVRLLFNILIALLLALVVGPALATYCTNGATNYPKCDNKSSTSAGSTSASSSSAQATASAQAGAQASIAATVGTSVENASAGGAAQSAFTDQSKSLGWSLALFPTFTPPMPKPELPMGCPAPTETQSSQSFAWGAVGVASSLRDNEPCVAIKLSQMLWERCRYQDSARVLAFGIKKLARSVGEDWDASADKTLTNYTDKECAVLTAPAPVRTSDRLSLAPGECLFPPDDLDKRASGSGRGGPTASGGKPGKKASSAIKTVAASKVCG